MSQAKEVAKEWIPKGMSPQKATNIEELHKIVKVEVDATTQLQKEGKIDKEENIISFSQILNKLTSKLDIANQRTIKEILKGII